MAHQLGVPWLLMKGWGRNLMAKDEFKNLGFREEEKKEEGVKGELRW